MRFLFAGRVSRHYSIKPPRFSYFIIMNLRSPIEPSTNNCLFDAEAFETILDISFAIGEKVNQAPSSNMP